MNYRNILDLKYGNNVPTVKNRNREVESTGTGPALIFPSLFDLIFKYFLILWFVLSFSHTPCLLQLLSQNKSQQEIVSLDSFMIDLKFDSMKK